uniref:EF-hand domain-containing protein n=1 Tax=Dracunculus medinensis TaxID=318479 RepID=A0A0N4UKL0_DRAME
LSNYSEISDSISVDELMDLLREKFDERSGLNEMRTAFELFDNTSKGYISVDDLQRVARELGEEIDDEQLKEMIVEADSEGFGKVSEADFFTVMKKTALY